MKSKVYIARFGNDEDDDSICEKTRQLFEESGMNSLCAEGQLVALKTHFGEMGNEYYIPPKYIQPIINSAKDLGAKPFFIETSALYRGQRANAVDHFQTALNHGFAPETTGCPLIFVDGLKGSFHHEVEVGLKHFDSVAVAGDFPLIPATLVISHATGHDLAGFGGAIKNVAMGLASRAGKLRQHESGKPEITEDCIGCGTCAEWCPTDAIEVDETAEIDYDKCIGCGECLAVCPTDAVSFSWSESPENFNEKMAESAYGILKDKMDSVAFITYLWNITDDCNCAGKKMDPICDDIGIVVSRDPVAIDQASTDLINETAGKDAIAALWPDSHYEAQLIHGQEIGLGSREYDLVEI
ncbi:MAG: DUF362 domain-containing protein [Candidatus Brocadiia bacterium]